MLSSSRNLALETAAAELVHAFGGKWKPGGAMCHCPAHDDATPSLSVRVGDRSLLFKCFAGCPTTEVLRMIRKSKLRVPVETSVSRCAESVGTNALMAARAEAIWREAAPIEGTPADRYLAARGILRGTAALRYHRATPIGRGRAVRFLPALIAAIHQRNRLVAIQRIFLSRHQPSLARELPRPKLTLGRPLGGAVMLDPAGAVLGLAEGVETALSAAMLLGIPVWAALGSERLAAIALPPAITELVLLPDADRGGRLAERRARNAYARNGLLIRACYPWNGCNDWNDVLQSEGKKGRSGVRLAA